MRGLSLAALAAALLAAPPARADDPPTLTLAVGEQRALGGNTPMCDDPRVATISAEGAGVLRAVGPGETVCSVTLRTGVRQVYRVVVVRPPEAPKGGGDGRAPSPDPDSTRL